MPKSVPVPCTLPSGRTVPLGIAADPRRPWDWVQHAGHYVVQREKRGDASALETYRDPYGRKVVLLDTPADAAGADQMR